MSSVCSSSVETYPFVIGKYYYFESYGKSSNTNIARCDDFTKNDFSTRNWAMSHNLPHLGTMSHNLPHLGIGSWNLKDMANIREATEEELRKYLPENHEDYPKQTVSVPIYEIGKWYDFDNPDYEGKVCAKFLEISDEGKYWHFSEYIGDEKWKKYDGNWYTYKCTGKLTDLSTIQQYLPDGHPDKMKTLEKGKWYKRITVPRTFIKFSHLEKDGNIRSSEDICNKTYCNKNSGFGFDIDEFVLVTDLSEISDYLPENHPDKIDYNKDYCPENCKWILKSEQSKNSRRVKLVEYLGKEEQIVNKGKEVLYSEAYKNTVMGVTLEHGKWYYIHTMYKWYIKFDKIEKGKLYCLECIDIQNKKYRSKGQYSLEHLKSIKKATVEEIQSYLPEGHVDKITGSFGNIHSIPLTDGVFLVDSVELWKPTTEIAKPATEINPVHSVSTDVLLPKKRFIYF